jgi:MraZ protein
MVKTGGDQKLIGEYTSKIVAGHRVSLPSALRKQLGKAFVLTKGYEGCLLIVPTQSWEKLIAPMESRSFLDRNVRDSMRFLVGSAFDATCDTQGRVVVPESLRKYADTEFVEKFDKEVVFVGLMNWIEIWEKKRWATRSEYLETNADSIAQILISASEAP